jgi:hypothetical protein
MVSTSTAPEMPNLLAVSGKKGFTKLTGQPLPTHSHSPEISGKIRPEFFVGVSLLPDSHSAIKAAWFSRIFSSPDLLCEKAESEKIKIILTVKSFIRN